MLRRLRNRPWGPGDIGIAAVLGALLVAAVVWGVTALLPEECEAGLEKRGDECIGVTEEAFSADPEIDGLIGAVADENARVKQGYEDPQDGRPPVAYVRVALMMPFTADATSAMTMDQIKRALAGAHAAQLRANDGPGPHYQMVLAKEGKDLDHWSPVVETLSELTQDKKTPLVAAMGMPSSTPEMKKTVEALSERKIPSVGPVITSANMEAESFFKTSPSNEHFTEALSNYLDDHPGEKKGYLVFDSKEKDIYSSNLRQVYRKHFSDDYGLRTRLSSFLGVTGDNEGIPQRFSDAARGICGSGADTVFYAGRDNDLPALIERLADEGSCGEKPLRILKVGIGLEPVLTTPEVTQQLQEAHITLVNASSVDTRWWDTGERKPEGLDDFRERFDPLAKEHDLGDEPLDDGYAVMYHDAFRVVDRAVEGAYSDANRDKKGDEAVMPSKGDVYQTIVNMRVSGGDSGGCLNCVDGASGSFGFDSLDTQNWPVCKSVPVTEYPAPGADKGDDGDSADDGKGGSGGKPERQPYRTYEKVFGDSCP